MTTGRQRGFPSLAVIGAWVVFVAALGTVLVGELLDFGFFQRTESFRGPFDSESSQPSRSFVVVLGKTAPLPRLFSTSGDIPSDPYRSNLRLQINGQPAGPPHTIHEEIRREGGGRYSHWGDAVLFSLPEGTVNGPETIAVVEYSPRLISPAFATASFALLFSGSILAFRAWRIDPESMRRAGTRLARSLGVLWLTLFAVTAAATAIYFATIVIGLVQGYALPNTAVFRLLPWTRELALFEPSVRYVFMLVAMVGAVLSWLAPSAFQKNEEALIRSWNRFGLFVIAALFLFLLGATWSGIARREDLQTSAIGGLVPFIDAHGHYEMTVAQVITGSWGPLAEQRPFAAAHRSLLMFFAGYSNVRFLVLQALTIACVTYAATRAMMRWRGPWAGLMFLGLTLALVRPYLSTHLTEPVGLFWGLLSVTFVIRLLRHETLADAAVGFWATTLALLTRMGSMLTIPSFAIWLAWNRPLDAKRLKLRLLAVAAVLLGCFLVSATLLRLYGSGSGFVGSNFSSVICGATHGGDWTKCESLYRQELRQVGPSFSAAQAHYLYAKAWEGFRRDPSVLFHRLMEGENAFLQNLVGVMLGGYTGRITPRWFSQRAWTVIAVFGLAITLWRQREPRELSFWLFMWLGLLTSAPLIIFADGWRALSSVLPIAAVFFASGFATRVDRPASVVAEGNRTSNVALASLLLTMSLWIVIPGLAHWLDPLGIRAFKTVPMKPGERIVVGSRYMAGFVVVPDDGSVPTDVPAMRRLDFKTAFNYSGNETYQHLTLPAPSIPFAFVAAPNADGSPGNLFLAPPEVLSRRDVRGWRFSLDDPEEKKVYWFRVNTATPVPPLAK